MTHIDRSLNSRFHAVGKRIGDHFQLQRDRKVQIKLISEAQPQVVHIDPRLHPGASQKDFNPQKLYSRALAIQLLTERVRNRPNAMSFMGRRTVSDWVEEGVL